MPDRLIAFGDIHGCDAALAALVEEIAPSSDDELVFLGDYVDRGPDSRQVIDRLIELRETLGAVTVLGNHEEMMLQALRGQAPIRWWATHGGAQTLESYGALSDPTRIPMRHIEFLDSCVEHHVTRDFFFVHANYVANELLANQPAEALRWQSLAEQFPGPHASGRIAVVGHTAQKDGEVLDAGHLRCIDTYCHGGGWLTAMEAHTGRVWQADRNGNLRVPQ